MSRTPGDLTSARVRWGSQTLAIARREWASLFASPMAYIVLFVFVLVQGATFRFHTILFDGDMDLVTASTFGGATFWLLWLLVPPLVTMRSFAEERRTGTFELLVTTGVGDGPQILGKWLAAWGFLALLWGSVLPLFLLAELHGSLDWGIVASALVGVLLSNALLVSIGIFSSTLSQNQLVAAVVAFSLNLTIFLANQLRALFPPSAIESRFFEYISIPYHFARDFCLGVVDLRTLILYLGLALALGFAAGKVLERRRWA